MPSTRLALLVSAALAAPCALAALDNYTIALRTETGGRDIVVNATPGPVAAVQVTNRTSSRVRCFVDFDGGRMTPVRREAWLDGNTVATIQQRVNDPDITSLGVALSCDSLSADEPIPAAGLGNLIVRGIPPGGTTGLPATQPANPLPQLSAPAPRPTPMPAPRPPANSGTTTIISPR
jgi:hypothetical protein